MKIEGLKDFRLVGGTALSLMLGHRRSIDIDMFTATYTKSDVLLQTMRKYYPRTEIRDIAFGIQMYLKVPGSKHELKVDLMCNEEYIRPFFEEEGIRIAHIADIAAMKLEAITTRKEKKDYWDIAEILGKYSLQEITGL
jgi:predicted nucleotidyltransferase component of viral defense system